MCALYLIGYKSVIIHTLQAPGLSGAQPKEQTACSLSRQCNIIIPGLTASCVVRTLQPSGHSGEPGKVQTACFPSHMTGQLTTNASRFTPGRCLGVRRITGSGDTAPLSVSLRGIRRRQN